MLGELILGTFAFDNQVRVKSLGRARRRRHSASEEVGDVLGPLTGPPVGHLEAFGAVVPEERFNAGVLIKRRRDVGLEAIVAGSQIELRVLRLDNVLETRLERMPVAGASVDVLAVKRAACPLKTGMGGSIDRR